MSNKNNVITVAQKTLSPGKQFPVPVYINGILKNNLFCIGRLVALRNGHD